MGEDLKKSGRISLADSKHGEKGRGKCSLAAGAENPQQTTMADRGCLPASHGGSCWIHPPAARGGPHAGAGGHSMKEAAA